jgi:putative membrane protein
MNLLWFKALHLISMVAWFAGLFYMFRLFVYHTEVYHSKEVDHQFTLRLLKKMEFRLYRYITTPAMLATMFFGLGLLVINPAYLQLQWLQAKLVLVALLLIYHFYIDYVRKRFEKGDVYLNSKQCRIRNEYPTPLLILIILLAVLRPF